MRKKMKTIVLIRHAKSDWSDLTLSDFERPLNQRGIEDAPIMADVVFCTGVKPHLMISSPAVRASATADIFATAFGYKKDKIVYAPEVYHKGATEIIDLLSRTDSKYSSIFLFGHNPYITSMASYFTSIQFGEVPTCGAVGIDFGIKKWETITKKIGKLRFFEYPQKGEK
jgi:phosphohistidine phosphatase